MAKVIFDADIEGISGKLSKTKSAMYCYNKKTGKSYRAEYNNDRKDKNSEDQQEVRTAFATKAKAAASWWNTNKPASDSATPTAEWTAMRKAYDAQRKIGNPYAFVRSKVKDDGTVTFLSTTTGGNTPQGGGGNSNPSDTDPSNPEGGMEV